MAPAAGGDSEAGESPEDDGAGTFLGNFWDEHIETAPEENTSESDSEDTDDTAGDDLFSDEFDTFNDDDEEEEEVSNEE